jgi:hypothetical protein
MKPLVVAVVRLKSKNVVTFLLVVVAAAAFVKEMIFIIAFDRIRKQTIYNKKYYYY